MTVRIRWSVIVGFGVWSMVVWALRTVSLWRDLLLSTDEKVVMTVMAAVFVVLGLAVALIGLGLRKWPPTRVDVVTVGVLGGWTCGVWFLRMLEMVASGDHSAPFIIVHLVLAVISCGLAAWSWQELASARPAPAVPALAGAPDDAGLPVDADAQPLGPGSVTAEARQ